MRKMASKFLLHFVHEHIPFRWPEFLSLTNLHNCQFKLISREDQIRTRPYIIIELYDEESRSKLIQSARGSFLLKGLYELWAQSNESIDHLAEEAGRSAQFLSRQYAGSEQSFRVNCESFGSKLSQSTKIDWIKRMVFIDTFESRPNLVNPKQVYNIFEMNENQGLGKQRLKEYYFGRQLTEGNRDVIKRFSLKERNFIANTSMDPVLSLIAANAAKVKQNDIVYDPFVGSGSLLVAAAHVGAYVFGGDIDWLLLHGKSKPTRFGVKAREENESVRANFQQYGLQDRYMDVMVSDITRLSLRKDFRLDAIISDPPYGVRERTEKIGLRKKRERDPQKEYTSIRYPAKTTYDMQELIEDLLDLAAHHLTLGGRLVYFLPVTCIDDNHLELIPRHSCLEIIATCEQPLTGKVSRIMVIMEKREEPYEGAKVKISEMINAVNFREQYFSKSKLQ